VLGDGAYLFSNPVAVHHAAALHELPVLFIVMNKQMARREKGALC
jgi:acetolactate synthase-1/2/3 large subunit